MNYSARVYAPQKSRRFEFMVRIDACKYACWQGTIRHTRSGQGRRFGSTLELLTLLGDSVDARRQELGLRSWERTAWVAGGDEGDKHLTGKRFEEDLTQAGEQTFLIRILFRQNATFQGEIVWLHEEKSEYFRSALELISLIQTALDAAGTPVPDYSFHSWKHEEEKEVIL